MNVFPFLLLKRSTAERLAARADAALASWNATWGGLPDCVVVCAAASDHDTALAELSEWRPRTLADGATAWIHVQPGVTRLLEQTLFGLNDADDGDEAQRSSPIGIGVAEDALEELTHTLIRELTGQHSQAAPSAALPRRLLRPGSGSALCTLGLSDRSIRLLLPAESLPLSAPDPLRESKRPPVAPLREALQTIPVALSVEVCRTELTLGHLRTLSVGDVLALPASVDHPLAVLGAGDTPICNAHLGSLNGFHAVELIRTAG